ncbi:MAG: hypothetical protein A2600_12260 [Candidatus Lambdaproteobacteria bacterium RIFOXYD1_FULL_56_27]|uniref:Uncharacterized protein n=1 Tax=Candidatus Lambdaproteobacteria bacterium RIFOXYD2_FULL_56_26 TaxID=1817773 RepID=A0A1F6GTG3_9PROT|nr:MAG: hypothetical protein A2426_12025 [Candidatus Lambdaproteobacteria bacterium RIFOXYC1_FULL_56_13]OGH01281.1 MAG: hypothetical protein A2557_11420 [Candidatus Lambdaproteobacteria bacterium RIFOXYD2_FULL_56_26]OGH06258.1 MAG: hypothetical protein A2600_12260 [Candidatus Lambdaproteobacteria bacterium RIFOXYD1_FULL_56_27]
MPFLPLPLHSNFQPSSPSRYRFFALGPAIALFLAVLLSGNAMFPSCPKLCWALQNLPRLFIFCRTKKQICRTGVEC